MPEKPEEYNIALPGFEGLALPDTDRAGSQDFKDKQYTGLKIRRDYPQTFESVVRALFYYKLPVRTCCDLFRMNSQCVSAIRDMVIAEAATDARAAFLINNRQRSQRDIILTRLVEAITEKLDDEEAVKKLSIDELTLILNRLDTAKPARNGTDTPSKQPIPTDGKVIDVDAYDVTLDRLNREKKRAAEVSSASADNPPENTLRNVPQGAENMATTHCYRATYPNKHGRFRLRCVIDCVTCGRSRAIALLDRRARSRVRRLSPPSMGGGGTPGVARGRG